MKKISTFVLSTLMVTTSFGAFAAEQTGKEIAELSFTQGDADSNGSISLKEMLNFGDFVFVSMDENEDKSLTIDEMSKWGFGFDNIAVKAEKDQSYETAMKVVFDLWDRNNDQKIESYEHQAGLLDNFNYADLDDNSDLSKDEYLNGFIINIVMRSALKPAA